MPTCKHICCHSRTKYAQQKVQTAKIVVLILANIQTHEFSTHRGYRSKARLLANDIYRITLKGDYYFSSDAIVTILYKLQLSYHGNK